MSALKRVANNEWKVAALISEDFSPSQMINSFLNLIGKKQWHVFYLLGSSFESSQEL